MAVKRAKEMGLKTILLDFNSNCPGRMYADVFGGNMGLERINRRYWNELNSELAGCSFGVYLIHLLVLCLVNRYAISDNISFEPLLCVPVLIILVYFFSFALVWIFKIWKMGIELHLQ